MNNPVFHLLLFLVYFCKVYILYCMFCMCFWGGWGEQSTCFFFLLQAASYYWLLCALWRLAPSTPIPVCKLECVQYIHTYILLQGRTSLLFLHSLGYHWCQAFFTRFFSKCNCISKSNKWSH